MASRPLHPDSIGTEVIRRLTGDLASLAASASTEAVVPACPDWSFGDLLWHMLEVQHFWTYIVEARPALPDSYVALPRPEASQVADRLGQQALTLTAAIESADDSEAAWTWVEDPADHTVGFIRRRQTHEVLIHLADGCRTANASIPAVDPPTWADGVDEIINVNLSDAPAWGTVTSTGRTVELRCNDTGDSWQLELGRFGGVSPNSGRLIDLGCTSIVSGREPHATVAGSAQDLDLWLWGRGGVESLQLAGDAALVSELRSIAADATQ